MCPELMRAIREVAVFAWAVCGINGNLANFGHGFPGRGAQPPDGLPVWDPGAGAVGRGSENRPAGQYRQITGSASETSAPSYTTNGRGPTDMDGPAVERHSLYHSQQHLVPDGYGLGQRHGPGLPQHPRQRPFQSHDSGGALSQARASMFGCRCAAGGPLRRDGRRHAASSSQGPGLKVEEFCYCPRDDRQ